MENCLQLGQRLGLGLKQLHLRVAENLGQVAGQVIKRTSLGLLTVFGGDTLVAIASALGWRGLLPRDEILPGVTISEVAGREGEFTLITKAGGFGPENVLRQVKDVLRSIK